VKEFTLSFDGEVDAALAVDDLAAALVEHAGVTSLTLQDFPLSTIESDTLVDAIAALKISKVCLENSGSGGDAMPSLSRLLAVDTLDTFGLFVSNEGSVLDGPALPAFCNALRASRLKTLQLLNNSLFEDLVVGMRVLSALTCHPTLRNLYLPNNRIAGTHQSTVGSVLAMLLTSNPVLTELAVSGCSLGVDGAGPLFEAVARSCTLKRLYCSYNALTADFIRDVALPAVQTNTSLRYLDISQGGEDGPEVQAAVALVQAREAAEHAQ
jgi:Ran GTPase-activating protein (RanGAP) involved in mRNA processing and transport